jgi:hypothetical protein
MPRAESARSSMTKPEKAGFGLLFALWGPCSAERRLADRNKRISLKNLVLPAGQTSKRDL